jgi:LmbE family N-acetylglucosaminyl deacetylase
VEIRYTTNFYHTPTSGSPLYTAPFELTSKATVKAKLFKDGEEIGAPAVAHFNFFKPEVMAAQYDWNPQPEKAALMLVFAHPDDETASFGGTIPYYAAVRKLPVIAICTANQEKVEKDHMRRKELEYAMWTYGLRNKPLYANFPDDCYGRPVSCCLESWGLDRITGVLTGMIRKYKPDVILTHDFHGEYGAPNHIVTGLAAFDAFFAAGNPEQYPGQLDSLEVWQPKKFYAHQCLINSWTHDWNTPYPELGGRTPLQVASEGILCHFSQTARLNPEEGKVFGLLKSQVGEDKEKNDFFENIDLSIYQPKD